MRRMNAVFSSVIALATVLLLPGASSAAERRPNILFLVCDEYRHDCLSIEGHPVVKTPNFDKLATEGARLRQAYVASPVCSPSRATLFTGRYPQVHGVTTNGADFAADEVVLPQMLKAQGYVTGMVGKLHLQNRKGWFDFDLPDTEGSSPEYKAFLQSKGQKLTGSASQAAVAGTTLPRDKTVLHVGTSVLPEDLFPEAWEADQAIGFIEKNKNKPFFLYVSMLKPHSEFVIPAPFSKMYAGQELLAPVTFKPGLSMPADFTTNGDEEGDKPAAKPGKEGKKKTRTDGAGSPARLFISDPEVLKAVTAHYYGAVSMVDKQMGRVIASLDAAGIRENTIIVFTSDHGNMLGERNRMFKGVMYDSSARVPMIYRGPGVKAGTVSDAVLDNTTVTPTLLDLAGFPLPTGIQGKSIAPLLRGEGSGPGVAFSYLSDKMVRKGDWKLVLPLNPKRAAPELFNVTQDPNEQNNLYGKLETADVQKELTGLIEAWNAQKPPKVALAK